MRRKLPLPLPLSIALMVATTCHTWAVQPSERLLPDTTKGYFSIQDVDQFREHWEQTELGALAGDPVMKPALADLRQQISERFTKSKKRLNIRIDDLDGVYGGEIAFAKVQPGGDRQQHATVLLVDITGHRQQADQLLARLDADWRGRRAVRQDLKVGEVPVISYALPRKPGETKIHRTFYFIHENQMVAVDHESTARGILGRFDGEHQDVLARVPAFQESMSRCQRAFGDTPVHARWFVEPFGYVEAMRAEAGGRKRRGTDMLKVLRHQGFDAVRGIGGMISLFVGGTEVLHRAFIYAPPVNETGEKYNLAARMLNFPSSREMTPQEWVPGQVTNYLTFHWEMQAAFEYSKTLIDEAAGAPVFDDVMTGLKEDLNGPRIDLRRELVALLGNRVSFFTDYRLPITPDAERWFLAFEITDPAVVARTLDKAMAKDPDATKHVVGRRTIWEIKREEASQDVEKVDVSGTGFGEFDEEEEEEGGEEKPLLQQAAFLVERGHLMVASHLDFMKEVLAKSEAASSLAKAEDYLRVEQALKGLGAGDNSFRFFTRTEKEYRTNYELLRQGKMPESKSLLGSLLNRLLGPEEEGVLREQQIRGGKLPDYEKIRKYFGPAGLFADSEPNGWFIAGCLLHTQ